MPSTDVTRRIAHPWAELYALVLDVESYPEFVPFCRAMTVIDRHGNAGTDEVLARMDVGFAAFRESYTSRIVGDRAAREIQISNVDGPFHHLAGRWSFQPAGEGATDVRFSIDYEFRNRLMSAIAGRVFGSIFGEFVEAFEKRAGKVLP